MINTRFDGFVSLFFFFQAEDGIRDIGVTGVQTCALPIFAKFVNAASGEIASVYRDPAGRLGGDDFFRGRAAEVLAALAPFDAKADQAQIGRASCRERV